MVAANANLDRVLDLASQLSPREQAELLVRIGQRLERLFEGTAPPGSPQAILAAMSQPPHLESEAVDEMEAAIRKGQMPVRHEGIFDDLDDRP